MSKTEEEKKFNQLYSRQIITIGKESMNQLIKLKILILGMRGNGVEIAKNMILSGVKQVTIYDPTPVSIADLCSNYYLEEKDINNRRDQSILEKLAELNPYPHVDILQYKEEDGESIEDFLSKQNEKYNVIVQSEIISEKKILKLSEYCHSNKIHFIYGTVFGLNGCIFNDFGENFTIFDVDGVEPKKYHCKMLTNEQKALLTLEEVQIGFGENDLVLFKAVEGMTELNKIKEPIKILQVIEEENKTKQFVLDIDTTSFGKYIAGGLVFKPKEHIIKNFKSFKESISIPFERKTKEEYFNIYEESEEYLYNEKYYLCIFLAIGKYLDNNKTLPELNNMEKAQEITKIAQNLFEQIKNHDKEMNFTFDEYEEEEIKQFNEKEVLNIINICKAEIAPMCSIIGGIISQEIIKTTGKYEPIEQWKFYDFSFIKPDQEKIINQNNSNSRYEEQIAIFGDEIQNKIKKLELFLIGSGAIGCELLKNFAMMGVSTEKDKKSIITDCDKIELSNLNRQFLFRKKDIGQNKSLIACNSIKKMNPEFNCISSNQKVEKKTENIFDEQFWKSKDFIICGLDNVDARNYVNDICHRYGKSFLDAGTNGTKGRITVVIPKITAPMIFSESKNKKSIPMCTLKYFPTKIEDCIEWSKENFNTLFTNNIIAFKNFICDTAEEYIKKLIQKPKTDFIDLVENIEELMNLLDQENDEKRLEKIIYKALECFNDFYNIKIKELLKLNPIDKIENGKPFWNAIKRAPKVIEEIDIKDKLTKLFIESFTHILANCFGINNIELNDDKINNIISEFKKNNLNEINEKNYLLYIENEEIFNKYKNEKLEKIKKYKEIINNNLNIYRRIKEVEEFEKDGLDNYHLEFIQSSANLRAKNYSIEEADETKALMIAGSIIQALPTTTTVVSGYLSLQLIALLHSQDIKKEIQNVSLDLSCNMFFNYSPTEYKPIKRPKSIVINESLTCQNFLDFCKNTYNYDVYSYLIDGKICFNRKTFKEWEINRKRHKDYIKKLNSKIEDDFNRDLPEDKKKKEFIIDIKANKINSKGEIEKIESEKIESEFPLIEYKP